MADGMASGTTDATAQVLFRYRAIDAATGGTRSGEQRGDSAYAVRASLRRVGLEVVHVEEVATHPTAHNVLTHWFTEGLDARARRRHRAAKADLCDGIATLAQAGIPLEQAVTALAASTVRTREERRMLTALRDRLREGVPFGTACAEHPRWFDALDLALIESGQHAGDLAGTLIALAQHHQRAGALGQRLFVALAYPAVLVAAGLAALVFMSHQTLPQLATMIIQARREPPWLTQMTIVAGQGLLLWWPVLLALIAGGIIGARTLFARMRPDGRIGRWWHGNPLARLLARMRVAELAATLARLRRSGMPLADALAVAARTSPHRGLRRLLDQALEAVRRGEDFSTAVAASPLLDPEFAQLLQLGERSGELTEMLERIAERYQRSAERASERLSAILGPAAILILAVLIGILVMAAVLPLMQIGDLV